VSFLTVPDAARLLYEEAQSHERGNYDDRSHSRARCRRGAVYRRNAEAAVASFARKLVPVEVRVPDDLDTAFQVWARERVDLGLILPDGMFLRRQLIATLATAARLSTLRGFREHVEDGGLMSGSPPVRVGGAARPMSIRCSERSQTRRSASGNCLQNSSKLNADWEILSHLKKNGRKHAGDWLEQSYDRLGVESTVDLGIYHQNLTRLRLRPMRFIVT
jgi:hypothetical protein